MTPDSNSRETMFRIKEGLANITARPLKIATRYVIGYFGIELPQSETTLDQYFSPKGRAAIYKDYVAGAKTTELNGLVEQASKAAQTHLAGLTHDKTGFETLKADLQARVTANPADAAVRDQLHRLTLKETDFFNEPTRTLYSIRTSTFDIDQFQKRMDVLHELLKNNDVDDPRVIIAYVKAQYKELQKQLDKKKTDNLALIKTQMDIMRTEGVIDAANIAKLDTSLQNLVNEPIDKAKKDLETAFEKDIPAVKEGDKEKEPAKPCLFSNLDKAGDKSEAELFALVMFSEKIKAKEAVEPGLAMGAGLHAPDDPRRFRRIKFDDYVKYKPEREKSWISSKAWVQYFEYLMNNNAELVTRSGVRISFNDNGGAFMEFPPGWALYYHLDDALLEEDMMMMVNEIDRQGKTTITLTLETDDPKLRAKIMAAFYYAAKTVEPPSAAFADENIKFNVTITEEKDPDKANIKDKSAKEVMGHLGNAPNRVNNKLQFRQAEREELKRTSEPEMRSAVADLDQRIDDILNHAPIHGRGLGL